MTVPIVVPTDQSCDETGAPKDAGAFMIVYRDWLEPLDYNAAYAAIFQRILWRSDFHGLSWSASHAQIAEETGFPLRTVRRATKHLREIGWLTAERTSTWDATTCWTPHFSKVPRQGRSGHIEVADPDNCDVADVDASHVADVDTSSSQTAKTTSKTAAAATSDGISTSPRATESGTEQHRPNRYPGKCVVCEGYVAAKKGHWLYDNFVKHADCDPDAEPQQVEPESVPEVVLSEEDEARNAEALARLKRTMLRPWSDLPTS